MGARCHWRREFATSSGLSSERRAVATRLRQMRVVYDVTATLAVVTLTLTFSGGLRLCGRIVCHAVGRVRCPPLCWGRRAWTWLAFHRIIRQGRLHKLRSSRGELLLWRSEGVVDVDCLARRLQRCWIRRRSWQTASVTTVTVLEHGRRILGPRHHPKIRIKKQCFVIFVRLS